MSLYIEFYERYSYVGTLRLTQVKCNARRSKILAKCQEKLPGWSGLKLFYYFYSRQ